MHANLHLPFMLYSNVCGLSPWVRLHTGGHVIKSALKHKQEQFIQMLTSLDFIVSGNQGLSTIKGKYNHDFYLIETNFQFNYWSTGLISRTN